jgi:DNA-binding HxlR family transcriptional regulator
MTSYHTRDHTGPQAREQRAGDWSAGLPEALAVLGDRWSLAIVAQLLAGPLRFGALQDALPAISPNVLSQRLRALQDSGVVLATPYSERPPRFLYELTSAGEELAGPLRLLGDWGARRAGAHGDAPRHTACETPLELRWYCPSCEEPVDAPVATAEHEELYFA